DDIRGDALADALVAVGPFDLQTLFFEEAFVVGDELGQALEWLSRFQRQFLHERALRAPRGGLRHVSKEHCHRQLDRAAGTTAVHSARGRGEAAAAAKARGRSKRESRSGKSRISLQA